ncbi:MAG: hypothetical protein QXE57_02015 [Nitrososphaerales archaeon]
MKSASGVLRKMIENLGLSWSEWGPKISSQIDQIRASTLYTKQELLEALTTLIRYGIEPEEALKTLSVAIDTAAGSGRTLKQVVEDLGQAFRGQASDLKSKYGVEVELASYKILELNERVESLASKYGRLALVEESVVESLKNIGVSVDEASKQTLTWSEVVERMKKKLCELDAKAVEEFLDRYGAASTKAQKTTIGFSEILTNLELKFRGSAQAAYEAEGAYARFANLMEEVKEVVGSGLIPILEALGNTLVTWARPEGREKIFSVLERGFTALVAKVSEGASQIQILNDRLRSWLLEGYEAFFSSISLATTALVKWIQDNLIQTLHTFAETLSNRIKQTAEGITQTFIRFKESVGEALKAAAESINSISTIWAKASNTISEKTLSLLSLINSLQTQFTTLQNISVEVWESISEAIWRFYRNAITPIQTAVWNFVNSIASAFNWLWDILAKRSIWPDMWSDMLNQTKKGLAEIQGTVKPTLTDLARTFSAFSAISIGSINITTQKISSNIDVKKLSEQVGFEIAKQLRLRNRI